MRWDLVLGLVLVAAVGATLPLGFGHQQSALIVLYAGLAAGFNIIFGYTGYLPFGYGAFFAAGAYGFANVVLKLGWPPEVALLPAALVSLVISLISLPMLRVRGAYFAIASLAIALVIQAIVLNIDYIGGAFGIRLPASIASETLVYGLMVLTVCSICLVTWSIESSRVGLALKAIRDDPTVASILGVNIVRYRALAWLISATYAGLLGGLYAWSTLYFFPDSVFSVKWTVFTITFAVFGGCGTVWGPVVGAALLYALYSNLGLYASGVVEIAYGVLLLILVLFFPLGLVPLAVRMRNRVPTQVRFRGLSIVRDISGSCSTGSARFLHRLQAWKIGCYPRSGWQGSRKRQRDIVTDD